MYRVRKTRAFQGIVPIIPCTAIKVQHIHTLLYVLDIIEQS